ncbi:MAG: hypothetical protein HY286_04120 [Planctomycetes bacterium]|nr:hypothetical protein [Planctomycetota bacterium]
MLRTSNRLAISGVLFFAAFGACRGHQSGNSSGGAAATAKVNLLGSSGCSALTPGFGNITIALDAADLAPFVAPASGALAMSSTENVAYLAVPGPAPGPAILKLDLDAGTMTTFADAARFAAFDAGVSTLTGIAILDQHTLVVADSSTNRLLAVTDTAISSIAGITSLAGGFADGSTGSALFRFSAPLQIAIGGDGTIYVPDPGNHRIRKVADGFVSTMAGSGVPGYLDGSGSGARFDTPDGAAIECGGSLLIGEASHHIRRISFKLIKSAFGSQTLATVTTVAGNGVGASVDGTGGAGGTSGVFAPAAINVGKDKTIFWLDRGTGLIRKIAPDSSPPAVLTAYPGASVAPGASFGFAGGFTQTVLVDSANNQILVFQ